MEGWMDGWREADALTSSSSSMSSSADMTSEICWTAATSSVRARRAAISRRFSSEYSTHSLDSVSCTPRLSESAQPKGRKTHRTRPHIHTHPIPRPAPHAHARTCTIIRAPARTRATHSRSRTHASASMLCQKLANTRTANNTVKRAAKCPTHFRQRHSRGKQANLLDQALDAARLQEGADRRARGRVHDQHVRVREQVQLHQLLMNPVPARHKGGACNHGQLCQRGVARRLVRAARCEADATCACVRPALRMPLYS
jgi:hypothetical protein